MNVAWYSVFPFNSFLLYVISNINIKHRCSESGNTFHFVFIRIFHFPFAVSIVHISIFLSVHVTTASLKQQHITLMLREKENVFKKNKYKSELKRNKIFMRMGEWVNGRLMKMSEHEICKQAIHIRFYIPKTKLEKWIYPAIAEDSRERKYLKYYYSFFIILTG